MKKYTFICEFQGGTYISQYKAIGLIDALTIWANNLSTEYFTEKNKQKIICSVNLKDSEPVLINGIDNVWYNSYLVNRSLLSLNIVETV